MDVIRYERVVPLDDNGNRVARVSTREVCLPNKREFSESGVAVVQNSSAIGFLAGFRATLSLSCVRHYDLRKDVYFGFGTKQVTDRLSPVWCGRTLCDDVHFRAEVCLLKDTRKFISHQTERKPLRQSVPTDSLRL